MPDITMCANGGKCRKRKTCYRWIAKPNEYWQSYCNYYNPKKKHCINYWETKGGKV